MQRHSSDWMILVAGCLMVVFPGCQTLQRGPEPIVSVSLAEVLDAHNARAEAIGRLWARASVQVIGVQADGGSLREQAQGHLQIEQPDRVALSLGKLGKVQLYLGSNDSVYWWMDMVDPDNKSVVVGRHDLVTPGKAELLGVPVYPRDLIRLLGITAIEKSRVVGGVTVHNRRFVVDVRLDSGRMLYQFDPRSLEPVRIEYMDESGRMVVVADLERYDFVTVVGDARSKPRIAEKVNLTLADGTVVRMSLYDPQNKPLRSTAFELEKLARGYRIETVYDLDEQPVEDGISP